MTSVDRGRPVSSILSNAARQTFALYRRETHWKTGADRRQADGAMPMQCPSLKPRFRMRPSALPSKNRATTRLAAVLTTMRETQHRVKNLSTVLVAICHQTVRESTSKADLDRTFSERVAAYCVSFDLMVENGWRPIELQRLVELQLEAFRGPEGAQAILSGPHIEVSSATAQNLGMALHELATNAVKYGALSNPSGLIRVSWTISPAAANRVVTLVWTETGGPTPIPTNRQGFGSKLTDKLVASALNGASSHTFGPEGVVWKIAFPVPQA